MAKRLPLSFAESAAADLEAILQYYNELESPDAGKCITNQIITKVEKLAIYPDMGRVVPEYGLQYIRELIIPPFRVVYVREEKRVRIIRVWRSERLLTLQEKEK